MLVPGEVIYLKAAPEITGTLCFIRDGRFVVAYPPSDEQRRKGRRRGARFSYPVAGMGRFGPLRDQPRLKHLRDSRYEAQE